MYIRKSSFSRSPSFDKISRNDNFDEIFSEDDDHFKVKNSTDIFLEDCMIYTERNLYKEDYQLSEKNLDKDSAIEDKNTINLNKINDHEQRNINIELRKEMNDKFDEATDIDDIFASDSNHSYIKKDFCKNPGYRLECDDEEGYYVSYIGEIIGNKYCVNSNSIGKGVFSSVVKCIDIETQSEVAIKIIRLNDMMKSAGEKEYSILKLFLGESNIVQVQTSFIHQNHLCIVFEWLEGSLKNYINSTSRFDIRRTKIFAFQIFEAMKTIHEKNLIHADFKPENILIDSEKNLKISDFGSVLRISEVSPTCYLVSRFYRAPEIILGCIKYGQPIDIWSVGCVLYECFTGNILFKGRTNNDMIKLIMEYKGNIPKRILKQGIFTNNHFSTCYTQFRWKNQYEMMQIIQDFTPKKNIYDSILLKIKSSNKTIINDFEETLIRRFSNLIEKCLTLDPKKRITAEEALKHPFFSI